MVVQQLVSMTAPTRVLLAFVALLLAACHTPPPGAAGGRELTSNVTDWRDEVIYQIVVDRFADGDASNNANVDEHHLGRYQGGDWQGIIDRIPYLKALGVTAVWISPAVKNLEQDAGFAGYHGYWTQDFLSPNPHFGDLAKLQQLTGALHDAGMKVILDIVTNHIGPLFYYDINMNGRADDMIFGGGGASFGSKNKDLPGTLTRATEWDPDYDSRGVQAFTALGEAGAAPMVWVNQPENNRVPVRPAVFQNSAWYHRRGRITVWENKPTLGQSPCATAPDNNVELCDYVRTQEVLGDFPGGLKDLATERADVRRALIQVFSRWIELADFDGFRIDTLKHVERGFWRSFCPAIRQHTKQRGKTKFLMFGEAFSGADQLLSSYTTKDQVDSVFYFSQKFTVFDEVFKQGKPTAAIKALHADREALYASTPQPGGAGAAPADLLINFIDNHDVSRFLHDSTLPALHSALIYLLTTVGVPCIYYGTEQQLFGGNDPSNREPLWRGNAKHKLSPYDTSNATFKQIQTLTALRAAHAPLRRGTMKVVWSTQAAAASADLDAGMVAYERSHGGETVLVAINTADCTAARKSSRTSRGAGASAETMTTSFSSGTKLTNVLPDAGGKQGDTYTVGGAGALDLVVPCRSGKVLLVKK
jgi:alpha-amylase